MQLIKDIMSFMATRNIRIISGDENDLVYENFVIIAFEILGWLKLEHKRTLWKQTRSYMKQKPLKLNFNYTWCNQLKNIVEKNERFKHLFVIDGTNFDFSEMVTEQEKEEVRKYVYDNYESFSIEKQNYLNRKGKDNPTLS
jgi:hypothetical protein